MGMRLHSCKVHKIEYGENASFNYQQTAVASLIKKYCEDYWGNDCDCFAASTEIEVNSDEFKDMISKVAAMTDSEFGNLGLGFECTREDVVSNLKAMYDEADKDDGYIHLSWF